MTRRKRYLISFTRIPAADNESPARGISLNRIDEHGNLIDAVFFVRTIRPLRCSEIPPLMPVDGPHIPCCATKASALLLRCPFIPNRNFVILKILQVRLTLQKPQKFMKDRPRVELFRCQKRKAFLQIKPHLVAENRVRTCAGTIVFLRARFEYVR